MFPARLGASSKEAILKCIWQRYNLLVPLVSVESILFNTKPGAILRDIWQLCSLFVPVVKAENKLDHFSLAALSA
jgi:hypothetical protein